MTVVSSEKNAEDLTLTFIADFDAPVDRVWRVWEGPAHARALVGSADVARNVCHLRVRRGRLRELLHDRPGRHEGRLVADRRDRRADPPGVRG